MDYTGKKAPCYKCKERSPTCHAECPKYGVWKAEHEKKREAAIREAELNQEAGLRKKAALSKYRHNRKKDGWFL